MKQILVMIAFLVFAGCLKPIDIGDIAVEKAIRQELEKPKGELTAADLDQVTHLTLTLPPTHVGFTVLGKLQNLESLKLYDVRRPDAGLKDISKLQKLETLIFEECYITDAGLKDIAKLQNLQTLYLIETEVTRMGMAELQKALPNCRIVDPKPDHRPQFKQ